MPSAVLHQPHSSSSSTTYSSQSSAYPSMKQFTFPITPTTHSSSSSTSTASSTPSRPPSSQRNRPATPVRPTLPQSASAPRASTATSPTTATMPASSPTPSLAAELDGVNARVDRKFAYWKSYWATVQQHAAATAAETTEQSEEKQQSTAGARSREQLEAVIRRMRETREEEMASSKLNTPRDNEKAKSTDKRAEVHERRWDASPRVHKTDVERKRTERRRTSEQDRKASGEQAPKSVADLRTERSRSSNQSSTSPPPPQSASPTPSATASTASSSPSASSPSTSSTSNLHRFWQDELHRQPHANRPSNPSPHSTAQRTRRRKMEHLTLPVDPEQARRLWEKMKLEMWQQWEGYQRNEDSRRGGKAVGGKMRVEEEKEPVDQPQASPLSATSFASAFASSSPNFSPLGSSAKPFTRASSHYVPPPSSVARPSAGRRSTEPGPLPDSLSGWSIRELRAELLRVNLTTHDCLEKSDMVDKLTLYHQRQQQQRHLHSPQAPPQPPAMVVDADRIIADVKRWSHNRSLVQLLNDLNHDTAHATTLQHDSGLDEVSRVYKKTLLRVHPDKCGHVDEERRVRATEVFKAIHDKFVQFRERNEKRGAAVE